MIFVKADDLKAGMRLAKPIYNKNGVLLYDRNSTLTLPGINSVKNFGLIGIYILEPAEPVPPLTKEDLEFEQKQTIYMFQLREIFDLIKSKKKLDPLTDMIKDIQFKYGNLDHRINFNQNLRSTEDYMYKHAISVAILVAMLAHNTGLDNNSQQALIAAGLLYDYGLQFVPKLILQKGDDLSEGDVKRYQQALEQGLDALSPYRERFIFMKKAYAIIQFHIYKNNPSKQFNNPDPSILLMDDIISTAIAFDSATGMRMGQKPESEIMAMKRFEEDPDEYNPEITEALARCIHIVPAGASVDLSTKDKGIVLVENPKEYMKPLILRLSNNQIYDLSMENVYSHIQIIDIMKTMDNRIAIDEETIKLFSADQRIKDVASKFRNSLYNK